MKGFGFLFVFLLIGTVAFMFLGCSSKGSTTSNPVLKIADIVSRSSKNAMALTVKARKLKGDEDPSMKNEDKGGIVNLEDYRPINPVPSSTASIRPGPIQHGTPLMPFIPKPSPPPSQETHGVFP